MALFTCDKHSQCFGMKVCIWLIDRLELEPNLQKSKVRVSAERDTSFLVIHDDSALLSSGGPRAPEHCWSTLLFGARLALPVLSDK